MQSAAYISPRRPHPKQMFLITPPPPDICTCDAWGRPRDVMRPTSNISDLAEVRALVSPGLCFPRAATLGGRGGGGGRSPKSHQQHRAADSQGNSGDKRA